MMQKKAYSFLKRTEDSATQNRAFSCHHRLCRDVHGSTKGVAVCVVNNEQNHILLGLERFGRYRGKFNVCSGGMEEEDRNCVIETARRELHEEFKITVPLDFWEARSRLLFFMGTTPVFILPANVNVTDLNARIKTDIDKADCPGTHKEMDCVRWVPLRPTAAGGDAVVVSPFVKAILKRIVNGRNRYHAGK